MRVLLLSSRLPELQDLIEHLSVDKRIGHVTPIGADDFDPADHDLDTSDLLIIDQAAHRWSSPTELEILCRARPNLLVMLLAREADAEDYVQAVSAGVREILPWPATSAEIDHAIDQCIEKSGGLGSCRHGKVMTLLGAKGGSGATFVAINLAYSCASNFAKRTLLIDLDLQYGDASFALGAEPRGPHIGLLAQDENLDAAFFENACRPMQQNLSLLAAPVSIDDAELPNADSLERVLALASRSFDIILLDIPSKIDALSIAAMSQSNTTFQIVAPTVTDLRNQQLQTRYMHARGIPLAKVSVILNKVPNRDGANRKTNPLVEEIIARLGEQTIANIPYDSDSASLALGAGLPVGSVSRTAPISKAFVELAAKLSNGTATEPNWRDRLTSWVTARVGDVHR